MFIVKDYKCNNIKCGFVFERMVDRNNIPSKAYCEKCSSESDKILTLRNTAPVDSPWINSVLEIVDKKSKAPHNTEFLKHPTRANYETWKAKTGLRHIAPGEKPPTIDKAARKKSMKKEMINRMRDRNSITVRG